MKIFLLAITTALILTASTDDVIAAHRRADTVLFPAFVAACNDWATQHPVGDPTHYYKTDLGGDRRRLELANKRWREFYEAMHREF